ncbi:MAG: zinc ribbon domain-containing protein [Candidatus Krumholzibacteriota bacterium]|nr:zinc ribbon domain-containing protein [Candidatus Krumholzibacteriota bacterium]
MPTYHYACDKCEHEFELEQKISDPPRKRCPKCRGTVYRVIYPVGHILKGSGFYKTDYREEDYKKKELAEKKSDSPTVEKKKEKKGKKAAKES